MNTKQVKKSIKKGAQKTKSVAVKKEQELEKVARQELQRVKKHLSTASKDVEGFIKKNPAKATAISASIGAALGGALAFLFTGNKKKTTSKKRG